MPDSKVQTPESATGTASDTPLTAPVSETLGKSLNAKLDALLKATLADEQPEQATPTEPAAEAKAEEEKKEEINTEETAANEAEATEENNDLSQEPEENADNGDSEEPAEDLPKGVKKRISKLSQQKRELEARIKELEEKVNRPAPEAPRSETPATPLPSNPYLHLETQAAVDKEIAQARRVRRWCEENPDGATVSDPTTGKETEYTAAEIRSIKLNAIDALEEHLPKQLEYVRARTQIDPLAEQAYPWYKDRTSKEFQSAQQMLQIFPELRKFPDYKMVIGDYITGSKARETAYQAQKSGQAAKAAQAVRKAPVQPTKPASAPAPVKEDVARAKQADSIMRKRPTEESLKKVILSQFL